MVFLGEFHHSLDDKGRVILPSKFRDPLSRGAIISKGDGCLFIYTLSEFEEVANEIREKSKASPQAREAARSFFAGASDVTPDNNFAASSDRIIVLKDGEVIEDTHNVI